MLLSQLIKIAKFAKHYKNILPTLMQPTFISQSKIIEISTNILTQLNQTSTVSVQTTQINKNTIYTIKFDAISSTMLISQHWPRELVTSNTYFIFNCKVQTMGQGQRTNKWISPEGNLYMTILAVFPLKFLPSLSVITGLSTCRFIQNYQKLKPQIKWINDVMVNHKKISGALVKTEFLDYNKPQFVGEIGIGVNIKLSPIELSTSLEKEIEDEISVEEVREGLIGEFLNVVDQIRLQKIELKKEVKKYLLFLGEPVLIYDAELKNILYQGIFQDINQNINALIKTKDSNIIVVADGRMRSQKVTQQ